jgi:hypothetical protein
MHFGASNARFEGSIIAIVVSHKESEGAAVIKMIWDTLRVLSQASEIV